MLLIILTIAGSWQIISQRNKIFKSDETLYRSTLDLNPKAHSLRRNLAVELMERSQYEEAKAELEKIIEMAPDWWEIEKVYLQLGDYYRIKEDFSRALEYYQKTIEVSRGWNYKPFNNLGALYLERGEPLNSLLYLCSAFQLGPEAKEVKYNLDRAAVFIGSIDGQDGLKKLYSDIVQGGIFQESSEKKIKYGDKICQEESCAYMFLSQVGESEILFSFLILSATPENEIIKIKNRSFNPENRTIGLEVDPKYKDQTLTFIFPTCQGIYYTAETSSTTPEQ